MAGLEEDLIPWSEKYLVGLTFADVQHKQLVDIINQLYRTVQEGKSRGEVGRTLDQLIRCAQAHFAAEEGVLQRCGYPDFRDHHSDHERLSYAVLEFYLKLMGNEVGMNTNSVSFLKDWLTEEILDVDMKFAAFLKGAGVP